jgi:hypothetical protein
MNTPKVSRLILGERESVMQEARQHGGAFIDPHPEALKMLQASNIDPYLIYEQALLQQMEKRISRIDFVQANVEELFEAWKWKPETQIPIHVRLIIWLKHNAGAHGYEQSGNSWVLKK